MREAHAVQRLRVVFGVHGPVRYLSVLDLGKVWERGLRRARLPLAYTQGYNPHPRMQFASALPVGYSSDCEILDLLLAEEVTEQAFLEAVRPQLALGLTIAQVSEAPLRSKAPQATMREAHYVVKVWYAGEEPPVPERIAAFLERQHIPRRRQKKGRMAEYNLRPLIHTLECSRAHDDRLDLLIVTECGPAGSGRPEEVLDELAMTDYRHEICRVRLVWEVDEP